MYVDVQHNLQFIKHSQHLMCWLISPALTGTVTAVLCLDSLSSLVKVSFSSVSYRDPLLTFEGKKKSVAMTCLLLIIIPYPTSDWCHRVKLKWNQVWIVHVCKWLLMTPLPVNNQLIFLPSDVSRGFSVQVRVLDSKEKWSTSCQHQNLFLLCTSV